MNQADVDQNRSVPRAARPARRWRRALGLAIFLGGLLALVAQGWQAMASNP